MINDNDNYLELEIFLQRGTDRLTLAVSNECVLWNYCLTASRQLVWASHG